MDSTERLAVSPTTLTPTGFYSQKLWGFISPALEPWAVWSDLGLGSLNPQVSSRFLSTTCECGATCSDGCHDCHVTTTPRAFHPGSVSASPIRLDERGFFKPLVVGLPYISISWQLWVFFVLRLVVILHIVVQGGEACLPTTPSWREGESRTFISLYLFITIDIIILLNFVRPKG